MKPWAELVQLLVSQLLAVLVAFGLPLTEVQTGAVISLAGTVSLIVTLVIRSRMKAEGKTQQWVDA